MSAVSEARESARISSQIALEEFLRSAAEFGWSSAHEGLSLDEVRVKAVSLVHDRITGLVDAIAEGATLGEAS